MLMTRAAGLSPAMQYAADADDDAAYARDVPCQGFFRTGNIALMLMMHSYFQTGNIELMLMMLIAGVASRQAIFS